jgi:hypothetical protein
MSEYYTQRYSLLSVHIQQSVAHNAFSYAKQLRLYRSLLLEAMPHSLDASRRRICRSLSLGCTLQAHCTRAFQSHTKLPAPPGFSHANVASERAISTRKAGPGETIFTLRWPNETTPSRDVVKASSGCRVYLLREGEAYYC